MLFDPARGQAYHACSAARANALSARATRHLRSGQPWLVNLGDTGKGADVLPVLLGKALQRGNPLAGFTPFRGHEFDRLRQGLVALREFVQPLVDGHGFSVARRQLAAAPLGRRTRRGSLGGVGWDVGFEPTTSRTTIWRSTN